MQMLPFSQHAQAAHLFVPLRHNLVVESVLDGHTRGRVYVDNPDQPQLAVLWTLMDGVLLAGEPTIPQLPLLGDLLINIMQQEAAARQVPFFTITVAQPLWMELLPAMLPRQQLEIVPRLAFHWPDGAVEPALPQLPTGYRLQPLTPAFLARRDLQNIGGPVGWVRSFWADEATFARDGLGFAVLTGETVASWALSVYAGKGALELGVETALEYRGKGLATIVAAACVRACRARGQAPHWQCDEENEPSQRLAQRLGFQCANRFQDLRYWFNANANAKQN